MTERLGKGHPGTQPSPFHGWEQFDRFAQDMRDRMLPVLIDAERAALDACIESKDGS